MRHSGVSYASNSDEFTAFRQAGESSGQQPGFFTPRHRLPCDEAAADLETLSDIPGAALTDR